MKTSTIRTITLLILFTSFGSAVSQNYRVLQPERTTFYQSENEIILGMRVDSVRIQESDTIYYLLKNLQQVDFNCFHTEGPSWMGDRIRIRPDGETSFYNIADQPVLIKTKALLNEEWICYSRPDLSIRASISSSAIADILGFPDSVKTVSFQAFNSQGQSISHEVNNMNIRLSKNNGILTTMNFYNFPDIYPGFMQIVNEFTLVGYNEPPVGIQNPTWKEIFDHHTGDELHTVEVYSNITYSFRKETISHLLEKSVEGDTIAYIWENRIKVMINNNGNSTFTANVDTLLQKIYSNPGFDQLPGMAYAVNNSESFTTTILKEGFHGIIKAQLGGSGTVVPSDDSCYLSPIFDNCFPDQDYYKGLGGPYYYELFGFDECSNQLVYYKKGGVEWGTPIDFTVNTTFQTFEAKPELITIFPNPTSGTVNIEFKGNTEEFLLIISDYSGRQTSRYLLKGENNTMDISNLKQGIYMMNFTTNNQTLTKKLVKW